MSKPALFYTVISNPAGRGYVAMEVTSKKSGNRPRLWGRAVDKLDYRHPTNLQADLSYGRFDTLAKAKDASDQITRLFNDMTPAVDAAWRAYQEAIHDRQKAIRDCAVRLSDPAGAA